MPFTMVTDAMIGFNPKVDYKFPQVSDDDMDNWRHHVREVLKAAKIEQSDIVKTGKGIEFFEGMKYEHPLLDRIP